MKDVEYREALQNIGIEPSLDSWDRLSKKLTDHQNRKKRKIWSVLKYAALLLALISVGAYFIQPHEDLGSRPVIAAPIVNKDLKKPAEINNNAETIVVTSPLPSTTSKQDHKAPVIGPKQEKITAVGIDYAEAQAPRESAEDQPPVKEEVEKPSEMIFITGNDQSEVETADDEIELLLNQSRIKLSAEGQLSAHITVSANSLLNEVEDDLNKDLKEILLEKITKTLKNPEEAVTFHEN